MKQPKGTLNSYARQLFMTDDGNGLTWIDLVHVDYTLHESEVGKGVWILVDSPSGHDRFLCKTPEGPGKDANDIDERYGIPKFIPALIEYRNSVLKIDPERDNNQVLWLTARNPDGTKYESVATHPRVGLGFSHICFGSPEFEQPKLLPSIEVKLRT